MTGRETARGLALFGIGLGLAEVLATRRVAQAAGLGGHERIVHLFGWREIASGVIVLTAKHPERRLWVRVLGDALDGALLAWAMRPGARRPERALLATLGVAPVVALDLAIWLNSRRSSAFLR